MGAAAVGGGAASPFTVQQQQQQQQQQKMRTIPILVFLVPVSVLALLSLILVVFNGFITLAVAPSRVGRQRTVLVYRTAVVNDEAPVIRYPVKVLEIVQSTRHLRPETGSEKNSSSSSPASSVAVVVDRSSRILRSPVPVSSISTGPPPIIGTPPPSSFTPAAAVQPVIIPFQRPPRKARRVYRHSRGPLQFLQPNSQSQKFSARASLFFSASSPAGVGMNSSSSAGHCSTRFFMTWISPAETFGRREAFCVESLFKSHPTACLLILSPTLDTPAGERVLRPFTLRGFRVAALTPSYVKLFRGTPAESWFARLRRGQVRPGTVPLGQNLSNLLRLAALYKYGGVYLDADVVVLRSLAGLRNVIGAQAVDPVTGAWARLNNAVMVFDKGHPLLREFIAEFATTFDGSKWGHNGPYLVSRVAERWWVGAGGDADGGARVNTKSPEGNFTVLPPEAFYPVSWMKVASLFSGAGGGDKGDAAARRLHERWVDAEVLWLRERSYAVHLWNRHSQVLKVEQGSVVARIMTDSCVLCDLPATSM